MPKNIFIILIFFIGLNLRAQNKEITYDLLQYGPSLSFLSSSAFDNSSEFKDDVFSFGISFITMATTVKGLKHITHVERPDHSDFKSFPSGHAAVSFLGAELIRTKYKDQPQYWVPTYALAGLVSLQRIHDNHHRPLEVVSGAIVGIASVHLSKCLLKAIRKKKNKLPVDIEEPFDSSY